MRSTWRWCGALVGLAVCLTVAPKCGALGFGDECCAAQAAGGAAPNEKQPVGPRDAAQTVTHSYRCVHLKASAAERMLVRLFKEAGGKGPRGGAALAIVSDERTNTLYLRGPAHLLNEAREVLTRMDAPLAGQPPAVVGPPMLHVYAVPTGQGEVVAKLLQSIYATSPGVKITALGGERIGIWADPEQQMTIARQLQGVAPSAVMEVIPLASLDAQRTAKVLRSMFAPGGGRAGQPFIEADPSRAAVIVKGSREQVAEVRTALRELGEQGQPQTGKVRVITLEKGNAATLAEYLQGMLRKLRANPVRVIMPGQKEAPDPKPAPPPAKGGAKLPGKADAPVTMTAVGHKLIFTSDDPEALALAQELVRLVLRPAAVEGDFEVIRLRNANAAAIAKLLDDAFNGPRKAQAPGPEGGARIHVVADPATNAVLVKAAPLDLLTIRRLVEKALDVDQDSAVVMRPHLIGPLKQADAAQVAKLIQALYQDTPQAARPSVGVDERTNSVVLRCTAPVFEEVRQIVDMLERFPRQKK